MKTMAMGPEILSPSYFIGGVLPEESRYQHWKEGAELIYKLTKSGILYLDGATSPTEDLSWFYDELRNNDPFGDGAGLWMAQELGLTQTGKEILERYEIQLSEAKVSPEFIDELERIFEMASV